MGSITFKPDPHESIIRCKARLGRLKLALDKENSKEKPSKKRIKELKQEIDVRAKTIKDFARI